jgi:hypothetical protein
MTTHQRNRGRPTGSVAPIHRVRRDYRFSQETLDLIAQGRALIDDALNETAFVEQAIGHYTAFLDGSIQVNQDVAHLQVLVRDLERDLSRTQQALRLAEANRPLQAESSQPVPAARSSSRKPLYQILIKHAPGSCPALPDDYGFLYTQEKEYHCPIHLVFTAPCPINQARLRIEVLKRVPRLVRIWLTKDGYGTPQDDWSRGTSLWQRTDG